LKQRWAAEQAAADRAWAAKLEEQHKAWLKQRQELEVSGAARLDAAEAAAAAAAQQLKLKLEGRIAAIAGRLGVLAAQEDAREKQRQELAAQVHSSIQ
jgi:hypothetical protein